MPQRKSEWRVSKNDLCVAKVWMTKNGESKWPFCGVLDVEMDVENYEELGLFESKSSDRQDLGRILKDTT